MDFKFLAGLQHSLHMHNKNAFTLAEVLITLGIIGIVSALTIPIITANVQDKILESQTSKAENILANGYRLMRLKDEGSSLVDFLNNCNSFACFSKISKLHKNSFEILEDSLGTLRPWVLPYQYKTTDNKEAPFNWLTCAYIYTTRDGMIFGIPNYSVTDTSFDVAVDVNALSNPNIAAKDLHLYRIEAPDANSDYKISNVDNELIPNSECTASKLWECDTYISCISAGGRWQEKYGGYCR